MLWSFAHRGSPVRGQGADSRRLSSSKQDPPARHQGYLEASVIVVVLVVIFLFSLGFFLLLVLEFFLLLFIWGVVAALTVRLLFQILFIFRQLIIAPLEEKGGR